MGAFFWFAWYVNDDNDDNDGLQTEEQMKHTMHAGRSRPSKDRLLTTMLCKANETVRPKEPRSETKISCHMMIKLGP